MQIKKMRKKNLFGYRSADQVNTNIKTGTLTGIMDESVKGPDNEIPATTSENVTEHSPVCFQFHKMKYSYSSFDLERRC